LYFRKAPHATTSPCINYTACEVWAWAKLGAVRPHLGCGRTLGCVPSHYLRRVGSWLGLGASCTGVSVQFTGLVGLCSCFAQIRLLKSVFLCIYGFVPVKCVYTKTCGNVSCKALCLSFGSHISFIMFKCWR
jgi:hypothetical protein